MKPRLYYLDMLKGMAIFLVVMGHILTFCVRGVDAAPVFKFIGEIHMPLFFFVSGWLAVKYAGDGHLVAPSTIQRAKRLLLPMLGASTLWIYVFPMTHVESPLESTWAGLWLAPFKNGYWFTLVLFEIGLCYAALTAVLSRRRSFGIDLAVSLLAWACLGGIYLLLPEVADNFLSFGFTATYFPVFMAGVLARRHEEAFNRMCTNSTAITICLVLIPLSLRIVCWPWEYSWCTPLCETICRVVFHIVLAIAAIAVVKPWSEQAYSPARVHPARFAEMWTFLGKRSLAIYLLHYFFLFPMPFMLPLLQSFGLGATPLLLFSALWAIPVIALALGADYILSYSRFFCLFLTGSTPRISDNN